MTPTHTKNLNPNNPNQRKQMIEEAVAATVDRYGEVLKRLAKS